MNDSIEHKHKKEKKVKMFLRKNAWTRSTYLLYDFDKESDNVQKAFDHWYQTKLKIPSSEKVSRK